MTRLKRAVWIIIVFAVSLVAVAQPSRVFPSLNTDFVRYIHPGTPVVSPQKNIHQDPVQVTSPLFFIPNHGQFNPAALFYAQLPGYKLWISHEGLVFDHLQVTKKKDTANTRYPMAGNPLEKDGESSSPIVERHVSRFVFLDSRHQPEILPLEKTGLKINYFKGRNPDEWRGDIPVYQGIMYKGIYKNIDLKVYGLEQEVEYDWIIKRGGEPSDIRFKIINGEKTKIDREGNLVIDTGWGRLVHQRPLCFQERGKGKEREFIRAGFKKWAEGEYGFEVGSFDRDRELVIDPVVMVYSSYIGGNDWDEGTAVAVDGEGYVYVTGTTWSTDFPIKNEYQGANPGEANLDVFITKFDTSKKGAASLVYASYLGGIDMDGSQGIAVDNGGNVYITGHTWSEDFPLKNQYQGIQGYRDAFLAKIDTTKSGSAGLVYSTYLGGEKPDTGLAVAADNSGNAYICGWTYSPGFPLKNAYQGAMVEKYSSGYISRFDTRRSGSASLVYSTFLDGSKADGCTDIVQNGNGIVFVSGWTYSQDFPSRSCIQGHKGVCDAFAAKLDTGASGNVSLQYSTLLGGADADYGEGIAFDLVDSKYAYIAGTTRSANFPVRSAYQGNQAGSDGFVTKIDMTASGSAGLVYSTYLGGSGEDNAYDVVVDKANKGFIYITGVTASANFPSRESFQSYRGGNDAFVSFIDTQLSGSSSLVISTTLGGSLDDWGNDMVIRNSGAGDIDLFLTGGTYSTDFPLANYYMKDSGDENGDGYLVRLSMKSQSSAPVIVLSRDSLTFSAVYGGAHTGSQVFTIDNIGGGGLNWSATGSSSWISLDQDSGSGNGVVTVSVEPSGLGIGSISGTITVSAAGAENSPQVIDVVLNVVSAGSVLAPFGDFATPVDGSTVCSSIPVTGWVLDDIGVERVGIYVLEGNNLLFLGDASFIEGARPDIEAAYPGYPNNYLSGWGYMILTNYLPNGGNGVYTLQAIAFDVEGKQTTLGSSTINVDNINSKNPFGAIDTPTQGGLASGDRFVNWGWALTPLPNSIPVNGSTIDVWVDGVNLGHPVYNLKREDIANFFPGYANSGGAAGYFYLDTTAYRNGVHSLQWTVVDSAGNTDGIGSRYFIVRNVGTSRRSEKPEGNQINRLFFSPGLSRDFSYTTGPVSTIKPLSLKVRKGFNDTREREDVRPGKNGEIVIEIRELERLAVYIGGEGEWEIKPGPIGSTVDRQGRVFYWQPGAGFVGQYKFTVYEKKPTGGIEKWEFSVVIYPQGRK